MIRRAAKKNIFFAMTAIVFSLALLTQGWAGTAVQGTISFTTKPADPERQDTFSAYDRIYAMVTLSGLEPGEHKAIINWVDTTGAISQVQQMPFTLGNQNSYTFYSWIQLMKNGRLKSTLSGKRFDDEYIGRWAVHLFVDGQLVSRVPLTIHP